MTTNNAAELGKAVNRGEQEIRIEGDLAEKTIRIMATGKVAWVIAGGAITVAIIAVLAMSPTVATGPAAPAGLIAESVALAAGGSGAVAVLGVSSTVAAVSIGVGAKSSKVLSKLRDNYTMRKISDRKIILIKK